jgi:molybdenum cofactor synthesis domain-containing protein
LHIIDYRAYCTPGGRSTLNTIGQAAPAAGRTLRTAALLAVGSELTTGETRDTNGGELARALAGSGVGAHRILALPDDLASVTAAFREALSSVDLVVATGGLGPTPDDLTREALAAAVGEVPVVDPKLEAWLRDLFARRGIPLLDVNLKQAWRIPSSTAIPNPNGTAPGWWVDRPDGRVAVLLPGPPREMRAMWSDWVLPRLRGRRLGDGRVVRTLRTYGIGESHVAELLGDAMLRRANPVVATYARADWLDVRVTAVDEPAADGDEPGADGVPARTADAILEETVTSVRRGTSGRKVRRRGRTSSARPRARRGRASRSWRWARPARWGRCSPRSPRWSGPPLPGPVSRPTQRPGRSRRLPSRRPGALGSASRSASPSSP